MATNRTALFSRVQPGGVFTVESVPEHPGAIWFVGSAVTAASDSDGYGKSPDMPFATLDYAIAYCEDDEGDVIYVLPGHSEALTTQVSVDVSGIKIIGLGDGDNRPQFTGGANSLDCFDVSADNVVIENLYFNEATVSANASNINVDAAHCTVRRVHMDMGANDRDGFTVTGDGEYVTIEDCSAIVTADGPDTWITFEEVVDQPVIRRCYVVSSDGSDGFDDDVIDFGGLAITNPVVEDNMFDGADVAATVISDAASCVGDCFGVNRYAGSATDGDTVVTNASATIGAGGITAASFGANAIVAAAIATGAFTADAFAANAIVAATLASDVWTAIEGEAEDALEGENLDHLMALDGATHVYPEQAAADSTIAKMLAKGDPATPSTYDCQTDSQEALSDKLGAYSGDGGAAQDDSVKAALDLVLNSLPRTVTRETAALPQTTAGALFTVTGHVLLKRLIGVVTTQIGAVGNVTHLQLNSTGAGATTDLCLAGGGLDIDGDVADTTYTITGTFGDAMIATTNLPLATAADLNVLLVPGSLEIECAGSDGGDGRVRWSATYVPLEAGASMVAA